MKKINWPVVILSIVVVLLFIAYFNRDKMYSYISEGLQEQAGNDVVQETEKYLEKEFNYVSNGKNYEFTFLEFSSSGCAICKQMEPVLEEIKNSDKVNVNVVFLHIMKSESQNLIKYYGISAVPMQVLLDNKGKEFFRHYGFISAEELVKKIKEQKQNL